MLKKDIEAKLQEYENILREIGRWINPQQYHLDETATKGRLIFHLVEIRKLLDKKFYKLED